ncbi:uncharacterized protein LOC131435547 isoform X2 [Malaya genurostris]|uniref:uncharacterized protein LOC131435547 isoform X2 n=1 Tax=Malaya genurostris TaxID=325434 RepID=UPI0026F39477|nr:uncharacterized protein LOC131435547 isoform X2 [Malaya genurostris]
MDGGVCLRNGQSLGMGFCNSSFSLALNTYFVVRRNKAAGIAMTITGLGPILLPQLVSVLVSLYDPRACLFIIGALATHIIAAALLLQPVKRHMVPIEPKAIAAVQETGSNDNHKYSAVEVAAQPQTDANCDFESDDEDDYLEKQTFITDHDTDAQSIYGFEVTSQIRRRDSLAAAVFLSRAKSEVFHPTQRRSSLVDDTLVFHSGSQNLETSYEKKRWFQSDSAETVNLGSSIKIFEERERRSSLDNNLPKRKLSGIFGVRLSPPTKQWFEKSTDPVHLSSTSRVLDERYPATRSGVRDGSHPIPTVSHSKLPVLSENQGLTDDNRLPSIMRQLDRPVPSRSIAPKATNFNVDSIETEPKRKQTILQKIIAIFDLTLLKDRIYVNMMLGMAISVFAEINFSLMTPFILNDLGYHTKQIASIMSTLAVADLIFRFISPFVGDMLKLTPRIMYMISLAMLIVFRFGILVARSFQEIIIVAFFLGVSKGVRTVYMSLVIPSYIPIKRLPSAASIQMMVNGIILMTIGPLVGLIRDLSGNYSKSILFINAFTIVTLVMWAVEMAYVKRKTRKKQLEMIHTPAS